MISRLINCEIFALMWEMIKLNIRKQSLIYSTLKKAKISRREEELAKALNSKTLELEKIIEYRRKGSILRERCRWHNEGEKKYKVLSQPRETTIQSRGNTPIKIEK